VDGRSDFLVATEELLAVTLPERFEERRRHGGRRLGTLACGAEIECELAGEMGA